MAVLKIFRVYNYVFRVRRGKFFSVSNQRPDLAIKDLQNFFPAKSSDQRPDLPKTSVILENQNSISRIFLNLTYHNKLNLSKHLIDWRDEF